MGLAASQARLLTITSRLSSNELRQQSIANMKMRLANDSEKVSSDYSKALNNQTLKIDDQTLTYETLRAAGYGVMRTGDNFTAAAYTSNDVQMPTCKKPNEIDPIKYVTRTETKTETVNIPAVTQNVNAKEYVTQACDAVIALYNKPVKNNGIMDYPATFAKMIPAMQQAKAALLLTGNAKLATYTSAMDDSITEMTEKMEKGSSGLFAFKHAYRAAVAPKNGMFYDSQLTAALNSQTLTVEVEPAEDMDVIVPRISTFANTQNKIQQM